MFICATLFQVSEYFWIFLALYGINFSSNPSNPLVWCSHLNLKSKQKDDKRQKDKRTSIRYVVGEMSTLTQETAPPPLSSTFSSHCRKLPTHLYRTPLHIKVGGLGGLKVNTLFILLLGTLSCWKPFAEVAVRYIYYIAHFFFASFSSDSLFCWLIKGMCRFSGRNAKNYIYIGIA